MHILEEGLSGVDSELAIVLPFVWVANLYVERCELLFSANLSRVAHPLLCVDALREGFLEVGNELLHARLVFSREVLLDIEFAHSLAKDVVDYSDRALPACLWLLLA